MRAKEAGLRGGGTAEKGSSWLMGCLNSPMQYLNSPWLTLFLLTLLGLVLTRRSDVRLAMASVFTQLEGVSNPDTGPEPLLASVSEAAASPPPPLLPVPPATVLPAAETTKAEPQEQQGVKQTWLQAAVQSAPKTNPSDPSPTRAQTTIVPQVSRQEKMHTREAATRALGPRELFPGCTPMTQKRKHIKYCRTSVASKAECRKCPANSRCTKQWWCCSRFMCTCTGRYKVPRFEGTKLLSCGVR